MMTSAEDSDHLVSSLGFQVVSWELTQSIRTRGSQNVTDLFPNFNCDVYGAENVNTVLTRVD